ncbi:MAG: metal-dependent phosphohydrolase [Gloeocapsa sp. DLM2.Bin57]|nr:MAG: metal-dependent phosphohydrolase [Gloeocapsa sp. DLM2.Bin57]
MLKGSILEKLTTRHQQLKNPLNLGVYYKNTLVALCHALEDFILESTGNPLVLAAFQRGKWYLQEADRYGELAQKASEIVILAAPETGFTTHPTSNQSNVSLVNLTTDDPVAQEWHLMILSPNYSAMVLCQELSEEDYGIIGQPTQDLERKFYGFWTFEADLVQETLELAQEHIAKFNLPLAEKISQEITLINQTTQVPEYDLTPVVCKVVDYLESSQQNLLLPHNYTQYGCTKDLDYNIFSNKMQAFLRMAQIIDQADAVNPNAAASVTCYAEAMGQVLDLPAWQIKRLRLAGLLHRLPPLKGVQSLTTDDDPSQSEVLRIMPQLEAIAKIITHQDECWDGSGIPDGLAYDNIPLESRILSLVADFQAQLLYYQQESDQYGKALAYCQQRASTVYDPKLVQTLELLVLGLQQGMDLPINQPKIASGIWLLEEEEQLA